MTVLPQATPGSAAATSRNAVPAPRQGGALPVGLVPAAALSPAALGSLRRAFGAEVARRLPLLLDAASDGSTGPAPAAASAATQLADGCRLLGDAAAERSLRRLGTLLDEYAATTERAAAGEQVALLLGRWTPTRAA